MKNNFFITGIDTDSGKTLVSAIFCEAFKADYWKPIQAGKPTDSETIQKLITNNKTKVHQEAYLLHTPASPHAAAKLENLTIKLMQIKLPKTDNSIIVEGAGGVMVPINEKYFVIDIIKKLKLSVILVADLYLGSINHTLLTIEALKKRKIKIAGIIFNGISNPESERIILKHSKLKCLLRISPTKKINKLTIKTLAQKLQANQDAFSHYL